MSYTMISLIVNILFVVVIALGFLLGFIRGTKRSAVKLAFCLVGLVAAYLLTSVISGAIASIQVTGESGSVTLSEYLLEYIKSIEAVSDVLTRSPSLESVIAALPAAIISVLVFVGLCFAMYSICSIFYRIFVAIVFRKKKYDISQEGKTKKHSIWGGLIGAVGAFALVVVTFMPISSLAGTANNLFNAQSVAISSTSTAGGEQGTSAAEEDGSESGTTTTTTSALTTVQSICSAFDNSAFGLFGGVLGLDDIMFDSLSTVTVDGEKIVVRQELETYYPLYLSFVDIADIYSGTSEYDFIDVDYDAVGQLLSSACENGLFKTVVSELVVSYVSDYETLLDADLLATYGDILAKISTDLSASEDAATYLASDIENLYSAFAVLGENGVLDYALTMSEFDIVSVLDYAIESKATQALYYIFDMNMVRAATEPIVQMVADSLLDDADSVSIDTSSFSDDDWQGVVDELVDIVDAYTTLSDITDLTELLSDPMSMLSSEAEYDIEDLTSALGDLVDSLRTSTLFKNASGNSIFDSLLSDASLSLPTDTVYDIDGKEVEITSYSDLFEFITPSLQTLKSSGLYDLLTEESVSVKDITLKLADLVNSADSTALKQLLLPLMQVEPTKSALFGDNGISSLPSSIIDFSALKSYSDWSDDLSQITGILYYLKNVSVSVDGTSQSALSYILTDNADFSVLLKSNDITASSMLSPMLQSKSMLSTAQTVLNELATALNQLLEKTNSDTISLSLTGVTLVGSDSQTAEICAIVDDFVEIYKTMDDGSKLEDIRLSLLGTLLDEMKTNTYRTKTEGVKETGMFADAFNAIVAKIETDYASYNVSLKDSEEDYSDTDFTTKLDELQKAIDAAAAAQGE